MPKRKRESAAPIRRVKRKIMRRRIRRVPRGPFPLSRVVKLKLSTPQITLTCTSGALGSVDCYANWPIYGSRNAYGWDQWSALYNYCVVLGSKIQIYQTGHVDPSVAYTSGLGGIYLGDDLTSYTDFQTLVEANKGKFFRVSTAAGTMRKCKNTFSAKKFFNVKDVKDNMERLGAAVSSSSPGDIANYTIWAQPQDTTSTVNYYVSAVVEYICLFSEPKDVANS